MGVETVAVEDINILDNGKLPEFQPTIILANLKPAGEVPQAHQPANGVYFNADATRGLASQVLDGADDAKLKNVEFGVFYRTTFPAANIIDPPRPKPEESVTIRVNSSSVYSDSRAADVESYLTKLDEIFESSTLIQQTKPKISKTLKLGLTVGDKFSGSIKNLQRYVSLTNGTPTIDESEIDAVLSYEPIPGQVTLIDFWASWCPPCQAPMAHNQEMMAKYKEAWHDKARIIAISVDNSMYEMKRHIEDKKWSSIEHYYLRPEGKPDVRKRFGLMTIPHIILLDKSGRVRMQGAYDTRVDMEEAIKMLIEEEPLPEDLQDLPPLPLKDGASASKGADEDLWDFKLEDQINIWSTVQQNVSKYGSVVQDASSVSADLFLYRSFRKCSSGQKRSRGSFEFDENQAGRLLVTATCQHNQKDDLVKYADSLLTGLPPKIGKAVALTLREKVAFGTSCMSCNKSLDVSIPHWICTTCQHELSPNYAFCRECAEAPNKKARMGQTFAVGGPEQEPAVGFAHSHGLAFVTARSEQFMQDQSLRLYNTTAPSRRPVAQDTQCDGDVCYITKGQAFESSEATCTDCGKLFSSATFRYLCASCPEKNGTVHCEACFAAFQARSCEQISTTEDNHNSPKFSTTGNRAAHVLGHVVYREHVSVKLSADIKPENILRIRD